MSVRRRDREDTFHSAPFIQINHSIKYNLLYSLIHIYIKYICAHIQKDIHFKYEYTYVPFLKPKKKTYSINKT